MWNIIVTMTFFKMNIPKGLEEAARLTAPHISGFSSKSYCPSKPIIAVMALFYGVPTEPVLRRLDLTFTDRFPFPLQLF